MYQALYRKYRSKNFDDLVGQNVVTKTLKNAIGNNQITHAYLFTGPRGTGKTSVAKIFSKMLNCQNLINYIPCEICVSCTQINNNQNIDVIEIDAASNNGVDEIREIRNKVTLVPTNSLYKIYIIDEVHMLTTQAFNALLKTLEEPPEHVIFILATTEPQKIPKTILSRCQRFDFKKLSIDEIVSRLKYISDKEKINITDIALKEIALLCDGGMRDSISLLDQAHSYCDDEITIDEIHEINGTITKIEIFNFLTLLFEKKIVEIINLIEKYDQQGKNLIKIMQNLIDELKNLLIYKNVPSFFDNNDYDQFFNKFDISNEYLYKTVKNFSSIFSEMKKTNNSRILFEIEIIKNININEEESAVFTNNQCINNEKNVQKRETLKKIDNKESLNNDDIKKVRINNSLLNVSKKKRELFKQELKHLKEKISDTSLINIVELILDGELKVVSELNLIFVYPTDLLAEVFNSNLEKIELVLKKAYNIDYKPIAVAIDEWDVIKNDYNKKEKIYTYIEEPTKELKKEKEIIQNEEKNEIDLLFNDIIEYS